MFNSLLRKKLPNSITFERMRLAAHIPNLMSLLNLLCGVMAIVSIFQFELHQASWFIVAGALLDFSDGLVARMLKAHSELGKQLDSLADVVTFGVAPGLIGYRLLFDAHGLQWFTLVPLMVPLFGALRLARFNIDPRQSDAFIGIPIPANALFWLSLPLILHYQSTFPLVLMSPEWVSEPYLIVPAAVLLSLLMVSSLPMMALKFKTFGWAGNQFRAIFILLSTVLVFIFFFEAIPIILLLYVIISLIQTIGKP